MRWTRGFDLIVVITIAGTSLAVAAVTFGVLESSGTSDGGGTSLGGSVVGFVVTFTMLSTVYRTLQRSAERSESLELSKANEKLAEQVDDLKQQLIRGAPRPEGYSIELLENHRLVLARPSTYETRGGVILDIQEPDRCDDGSGVRAIDPVPARLYVNYLPAPPTTRPDEYYVQYEKRTRANSRYDVMAVERTIIGSDPATCAALKVTTRRCVRVTVRPDTDSGRLHRSVESLPRTEWETIDIAAPPEIVVAANDLLDPDFERQVVVPVRTSVVVCLHAELRQVFFFAFEDDEIHFVHHVEALNRCLRSVRFLT